MRELTSEDFEAIVAEVTESHRLPNGRYELALLFGYSGFNEGPQLNYEECHFATFIGAKLDADDVNGEVYLDLNSGNLVIRETGIDYNIFNKITSDNQLVSYEFPFQRLLPDYFHKRILVWLKIRRVRKLTNASAAR